MRRSAHGQALLVAVLLTWGCTTVETPSDASPVDARDAGHDVSAPDQGRADAPPPDRATTDGATTDGATTDRAGIDLSVADSSLTDQLGTELPTAHDVDPDAHAGSDSGADTGSHADSGLPDDAGSGADSGAIVDAPGADGANQPDAAAADASVPDSGGHDATAADAGAEDAAPPDIGCPQVWTEHPDNPVIVWGQEVGGLIWNDPVVLKEGDGYRMWLSGGTGTGVNNVRLYTATSADGLSWTIDPTPVLEPGPAGAFDDEKTETPMVLRVGDSYHLYYTGFRTGDGPGQYRLGHATSMDGLSWTKDAANPVVEFHMNPAQWGFYQAAEPGVAYDAGSGRFHLYYVTARMRAGYEGDLALQQGIALALSSDGSAFTPYDADQDGELDPVLVQSAAYPVELGYVGYSTPFPLLSADGRWHLFYDVVRYPEPGSWRQVALAHAESADGLVYAETETDIFVFAAGDWKSYEVRAPCVLQDGEVLHLWFAGNDDHLFEPGWNIGIGYAQRAPRCR